VSVGGGVDAVGGTGWGVGSVGEGVGSAVGLGGEGVEGVEEASTLTLSRLDVHVG
jgi:hypothetical protein